MSEDHAMIVCTEADINPSWEEWQDYDREVALHLHFHPEDAAIDPGELDAYSYFHPETIDPARLI